jgi:hypothetical protein
LALVAQGQELGTVGRVLEVKLVHVAGQAVELGLDGSDVHSILRSSG